MTRPLADWADIKYRLNGNLAHVVPFGAQASLCGLVDDYVDPLYGTGSFDEFEHARGLPACGFCLEAANPNHPIPTEDPQ